MSVRTFLIFGLFSFFVLPGKSFVANTDVVINEVSPNPEGGGSEVAEFIELYNKGSESVTITGWKISDTQGSTNTYAIPENTISAGGYKSFTRGTTGIALNNDGDGVNLKDNTDQAIDSMSFGSSSQGKSWSRNPNGTGSFANDTQPTENAANAAPPTPTPTNTPAPTIVPTAAPSATPTKTPTPTKSPTATKAPTPGKTTPSPTKVPTPTPEDENNSSLALASKDEDSLQDIGSSNISGTPDQTASVMGISTSAVPWFFIALGLILITVCGILAYFQFGNNIFKIIPKHLPWKKKPI
jgi:hypothetical protein